MNIEYNTQREPIVLKEYGRSIQKLIGYVRKEADKEKRNKLMAELVRLVERLSSSPKESAENLQRIWDDLYIIADFDLDVDSPYPMPDREVVFKKPHKMSYPPEKSFSRHGRNINRLLETLLAKTDPEERKKGTIYMGRLLNTFHNSWNKNTPDNATLLKEIENISNKQLTLDLKEVDRDNLFEKLYVEKRKFRTQGPQNYRKDRRTSSSNNNSNNKRYRRRGQ